VITRAVLLALMAGPLAVFAARDLTSAWRHGARRPRRPGRLAALLAALGRRVGVLPAPEDLDARLLAAGSPLRLRPTDLMAVKAGAALVAVLVLGPPVAAAGLRGGLVVGVAAAVGGYLAPDLWLRRRAMARARTIALELADVLDLLRVCVEAGLGIERALGEVGARHGGLLARELARTARAMQLGVPRHSALARLAGAAPVPALAALVAAIDRSARHGAPLSTALTALALDARAEHARALTERAAKAAPKIQLVVALLLVPAVMLLVAAAALRGLRVA
jgi:tight adherence protein C